MLKKRLFIIMVLIFIAILFAVCNNGGDTSGPETTEPETPNPETPPHDPSLNNFTAAPALSLTAGDCSLGYTWTDSDPAADSYDLYYAEGNGLAAETIKAGTKIAGTISGSTINTLKNNTTYSVLVTANKAGYNSINSSVKTETTNESGSTVWARSVSTADNKSIFYAVAVDNSGNVYAAGKQIGKGSFTYGTGVSVSATGDNNSGDNVILVKYNSEGTAQWARSISAGPAGFTVFFGVAVDASGNIYAAGAQSRYSYTYGPGVSAIGSGSENAVLVKYNSSGTAQWARSIGSDGGYARFYGVAVDNFGNVYAAGYQTGAGAYAGNNAILVKYDSEGTVQWKQSTTTAKNDSVFKGVAVGASGVYAVGYQTGSSDFSYGNGTLTAGSSSVGDNAVRVWYDSEGKTLYAQSVIGSPLSTFNAVAVYVSSIYAAGYQYGNGGFTPNTGITVWGGSSGSNAVLLKDGRWARSVNPSNASTSFYGVAVDASGNIYAAGAQGGGNNIYSYYGGIYITGGAHSGATLVKYDSEGTAQWVRFVNAADNSSVFNAVAVDTSGVYAVGYQNGSGSFSYGSGVSVAGAYNDGENAVLVKYQK